MIKKCVALFLAINISSLYAILGGVGFNGTQDSFTLDGESFNYEFLGEVVSITRDEIASPVGGGSKQLGRCGLGSSTDRRIQLVYQKAFSSHCMGGHGRQDEPYHLPTAGASHHLRHQLAGSMGLFGLLHVDIRRHSSAGLHPKATRGHGADARW